MNSTRWLGEVIFVYLAIYAVLAYRKAYEEKLWKSALKMAGVVTVYGVSILLVLMGLTLIRPAS